MHLCQTTKIYARVLDSTRYIHLESSNLPSIQKLGVLPVGGSERIEFHHHFQGEDPRKATFTDLRFQKKQS